METHHAHIVSGWQLRIAALLITLLPHSAVFSEIYKWTDDSGEIHYTQSRPPGGIDAEKIHGAAPPPNQSNNARSEQEKLKQQVDAMEERLAKQHEEKQEKAQQEQLKKDNAKNCISARNNLFKLEQGGRNRYQKPDGEVVRFTEEERQQRMKDANEQIKKYCS